MLKIKNLFNAREKLKMRQNAAYSAKNFISFGERGLSHPSTPLMSSPITNPLCTILDPPLCTVLAGRATSNVVAYTTVHLLLEEFKTVLKLSFKYTISMSHNKS